MRTYRADGVPDDPKQIPAFLRDTLQPSIEKASQAADPFAVLQYLHTEPQRLFAGMVALADGTDWNPGAGTGPYYRDESNTAWVFMGAVPPPAPEYLYVREEQSSATAGGGSTASTWHTRTLNTEVSNSITGASLASNQITLPAGTYRIRARTPAASAAFTANAIKARLRNITDSTDTLIGSSARSFGGDMADSWVSGVFTIADEKDFEIQTYTSATVATNGLGLAVSASVVEVYSEVEIWKV